MLLTIKELDNLSVAEKIEYYNSIKEVCLGMRGKEKCRKSILQEIIIMIIPYLRNYDYQPFVPCLYF